LWLSYFERVLIKGSNRRSSAIVLEELVEMRSEATATTRYPFGTLEWARQDARVFTNKKDELPHVVSRSWPKATALDGETSSAPLSQSSRRELASADAPAGAADAAV
jgi:hypothetical protein